MKTRKKYSTVQDKIESGLLIFFLAIVAVLVYLNFFWEPQTEVIETIPMANQYITWEGAGYNNRK